MVQGNKDKGINMKAIFEIYSHISAVIVTLEIIVMGVVVRKAWKYTEEEA